MLMNMIWSLLITEERKDVETYQMLLNLFDPNVMHIDNMKVLKALIHARDDKLPLLDGTTKRQVRLSYQIITVSSSVLINRHLL